MGRINSLHAQQYPDASHTCSLYFLHVSAALLSSHLIIIAGSLCGVATVTIICFFVCYFKPFRVQIPFNGDLEDPNPIPADAPATEERQDTDINGAFLEEISVPEPSATPGPQGSQDNGDPTEGYSY